MAELKNKKSSIENKVFSVIAGISLVCLIITSVIAYFGVFKVSRRFIDINNEIIEHAAENSQTSIEELTDKELLLVSTGKAEHIEEMFEKYEIYLENISSHASDMKSKPEVFSEAPYHLSFSAKVGSEPPFLLYSADADKENLSDEAGVTANIGITLHRITSKDDVISDAYYATDSGIFFVSSNKKFLVENESFDYKQREWYQKAKNSGEVYVSGVHSDPFGRDEIICITKPVYSVNGEFIGVAGVNIKAEKFKEQLGYTDFVNCCFTIFDDNGEFIISSKNCSSETGKNIGEFISGNGDVYDDIFRTQSGTEHLEIEKQHIHIAHTRLKEHKWIVVAYVNNEIASAPSTVLKNGIVALSQEVSDEVMNLMLSTCIFGLVSLIILLVLTYIFGITLSKKITKPIVTLTDSVKNITHGNLEFNCDIKTGDEIEDLSDTFRNMTEELKEYIDKVKSESKAKEHHKAELEIAKKIQMSILPNNAKDFDINTEFEIATSIIPAKGVGGDFYDYFMVDDEHLAITIADVSGKGVPAALFMMISKTLISNKTKPNMSPGEILTEVNRLLCINNDAAMFVTAFLGILNIKTGEFRYSNAGHTPPFVYRYKEGFDNLSVTKNLFLAGDEDTLYKTDSIMLDKGDMIFLYTDGVTEASTKEKKQYGKKRLYNLLNSFAAEHMTLEEIIANITEDIYEFVYGADQADDITMLITRFFN